jgi:hypothetical protein
MSCWEGYPGFEGTHPAPDKKQEHSHEKLVSGKNCPEACLEFLSYVNTKTALFTSGAIFSTLFMIPLLSGFHLTE